MPAASTAGRKRETSVDDDDDEGDFTVIPKKTPTTKKAATKKASTVPRKTKTPTAKKATTKKATTPRKTKTPTTKKATATPRKRAKKEEEPEPSTDDDESDSGEYGDGALMDDIDLGDVVDVPVKKGGKKKSVEEKYQKLTDREHLLKRPDTYVGTFNMLESVGLIVRTLQDNGTISDGLADKTTEVRLVAPLDDNVEESSDASDDDDDDPDDEANGSTTKESEGGSKPKKRKVLNERLVFEKLTFAPALLKAVDEIITNAADRQYEDEDFKNIWVDVDQASGTIVIKNDGLGIPVVVHSGEKKYVPEVVFSEFRAGENFDDDVSRPRYAGGRNGIGATATNVMSASFEVEVGDPVNHQKFQQTYTNNLGNRTKPKIRSFSQKKGYVKCTFTPDYSLFKMSGMDDTIYRLFKTRVYDIAGTTSKNIRVHWNGSVVPIKTFQDWTNLVIGSDRVAVPRATDIVVDKDKVVRCEYVLAKSSSGGFQCAGFVNGIRCSSGQHIKQIEKAIFDRVTMSVKRKIKDKAQKNKTIPSDMIRKNMVLLMRCLVDKPTFMSQTKDVLGSTMSDLGYRYAMSKTCASSIVRTGIPDAVADAFENKGLADVSKKSKKKLSALQKLDDASNAGKKGKTCSLIITEGDSAKGLADAGVSTVGKENFGIFPIRGKMINAIKNQPTAVLSNEEVKSIVQIIGLEVGKFYTSTDSLRYKHVIIFADQDPDGSHIAGLIIALFETLWPSLLRIHPTFIKRFATPVVKARDTRSKAVHSFFNMTDYDAWAAATPDFTNKNRWDIKFYKGLGTSTNKEAKQYFSKMDDHVITVSREGDQDAEVVGTFFGTSSDKRKDYMSQEYDPGYHLDYSQDKVSFAEFFKGEVAHHAKANCKRMIPGVLDGFKEVQRKGLYGMFHEKVTQDRKVADLAGIIGGKTAYHHGPKSMEGSLVHMAQNQTGSNNMNLLVPSGQFGTRLFPRDNHADPRYLFTRTEPVARAIFKEEDDAVLDYVVDDGKTVEPVCYAPVIPFALVNGSSAAIGTGWSCTMPPYNPEEILRCTRKEILKKNPDWNGLVPWFRGFNGTVTALTETSYEARGVCTEEDGGVLHITELPPGMSKSAFLEKVQSHLIEGRDDNDASHFIHEIDDSNSTEAIMDFYLGCDPARLAKVDIVKELDLSTTYHTSNINYFDEDGRIQHYDDLASIVADYAPFRMQMYAKRKAHILDLLQTKDTKLSNQARFILMVVGGKLELRNVPIATLISQLEKHKFDKLSDSSGGGTPSFSYLVDMSMRWMTKEKVDEIKKKVDEIRTEIASLKATTETQLWLDDLDELEDAMKQHSIDWDDAIFGMPDDDDDDGGAAGKKRKRPTTKGAPKTTKRARKGSSSENVSQAMAQKVAKKAAKTVTPKKSTTPQKAPTVSTTGIRKNVTASSSKVHKRITLDMDMGMGSEDSDYGSGDDE
jgi:DNA topoisomerase II